MNRFSYRVHEKRYHCCMRIIDALLQEGAEQIECASHSEVAAIRNIRDLHN